MMFVICQATDFLAVSSEPSHMLSDRVSVEIYSFGIMKKLRSAVCHDSCHVVHAWIIGGQDHPSTRRAGLINAANLNA